MAGMSERPPTTLVPLDEREETPDIPQRRELAVDGRNATPRRLVFGAMALLAMTAVCLLVLGLVLIVKDQSIQHLRTSAVLIATAIMLSLIILLTWRVPALHRE